MTLIRHPFSSIEWINNSVSRIYQARTKWNRKRTQAVFLSGLMIISMVAAAAVPASAAGSSSVESTESSDIGLSTEQWTDERGADDHTSDAWNIGFEKDIDPSLKEAEGQQDVLIVLEEQPRLDHDEGLSVNDGVQSLQERTESAQNSVVSELTAMQGVSIDNRFWIANFLSATVDLDRADLDTIAEVEGVDVLVEPVQFEHPSPPSDTTSTELDEISGEFTYGLEQIGVPEFWEEYGQGDGTSVAVIDDGMDAGHPDLELSGAALIDSDGNVIDDEINRTTGHGDHVSGTVTGADTPAGEGIPTYGVAPEAELLHADVFDEGGGSFDAIAGALEWAVSESVDVASASLGAPPGFRLSLLIPIIGNARALETSVVFSAGNEGHSIPTQTVTAPANDFQVFAVGASDEARQVPDFSSGGVIDGTGFGRDGTRLDLGFADEYIKPDTAGPGVDVLSAGPLGTDGDGRSVTSVNGPADEETTYSRASGTSMAAPHIAGALALLQSATEEQLKPGVIEAALQETADRPGDVDVPERGPGFPEKDVRYGTGIINVTDAGDALSEMTRVTGTVTDHETGDGLAKVDIRTEGGVHSATDGSGSYAIPVLPEGGETTLHVEQFGYLDETVTVTDNIEDIAAEPDSTGLSEAETHDAVATEVPEFPLGDVTETGTVGIDDAVAIQRESLGLDPGVDPADDRLFDVLRNGDVGIQDAVLAQRISLDLTDGADLLVEDLSAPDEITAGEDVDVEATIENTGDVGAIEAVNVTVKEETADEAVVDVGLDDTDEATLTVSGLEPGERELTVQTPHDEDTVEITVEEQEIGPFFQIDELSPADTTVERGGRISQVATITNVGDDSDLQDVEYHVAGEPVAERPVFLDPGETEEVIVGFNHTGSLDPGEYEHGVFSNEDNETATLTIEEAETVSDITMTEAVDVDVLQDQPFFAEKDGLFNIEFDVANLENLTVEFGPETDVGEEAITVIVDGIAYNVGEQIEFDEPVQEEVTVTIDVTDGFGQPDVGDTLQLETVFEGLDHQEVVTTRTTEFDDQVEPATFELSEFEADDQVELAEDADPIEAEVTVTNTGQELDITEVDFVVERPDSTNIGVFPVDTLQLEPGESDDVDALLPPPVDFIDPGLVTEYGFETPDDEAFQEVAFLFPSQSEFSVHEFDHPSEAEPGSEIDLEAEVFNLGVEGDTRRVEFFVGGDRVETVDDIALNGGERTTVVAEDVELPEEPGRYTVQAFTADDEASGIIGVGVDPGPSSVTVVQSEDQFGEATEDLFSDHLDDTLFSVDTSLFANVDDSVINETDVFVAHDLPDADPAEDFINAVENDPLTGVVYLEQGSDSDAITVRSEVTGTPSQVTERSGFGFSPEVFYFGEQPHPIIDDVVPPGEQIEVYSIGPPPAWVQFSVPDDAESIATVGEGIGPSGAAAWVESDSDAVLLSSIAVTSDLSVDEFTDDAGQLLANAIEFADGQAAPVGTITGNVTDLDTGEPVEGVTMEAVGEGGTVLEATTDSEGTYIFDDVEAGTYVVLPVSAEGYDTEEIVNVEPGETVQVDFELEPEPPEIVVEVLDAETEEAISGANVFDVDDTDFFDEETGDDGTVTIDITEIDGLERGNTVAIGVDNEGYEDSVTFLEIGPGTNTVTVELEPISEVLQHGTGTGSSSTT